MKHRRAVILVGAVLTVGCPAPLDPVFQLQIESGSTSVVSGSVIDLGRTLSSATTTFNVTNTGTVAATVSSVSMTSSPELALTAPTVDAIAAGETLEFSVTMTRIESHEPEPSATVTVTSDVFATPLTFTVTGTTGEPDIAVQYDPYYQEGLVDVVADDSEPFPVYTPDVLGGVDAAEERPFSISNEGDAPLNLSASLTPESAPKTGGTIAFVSVPHAIAPGTTEDLILSFLVSSPNEYVRAKLVITSDDPDEQSFSFSVNGSVGA
ncbi:MAG: hypothetical protein ACOC0O_06355 [Spirochaetota bacterium]